MTDLVQPDAHAPTVLHGAPSDVLMLPAPSLQTAPYMVCVQVVKVRHHHHHKLEARFSLPSTSTLYRNIGWQMTSATPEYPSAYIEFTFVGSEYPITHITAHDPKSVWFGSVANGQQIASCIARHGDYHFTVYADKGKDQDVEFGIDPIIVVTIPP